MLPLEFRRRPADGQPEASLAAWLPTATHPPADGQATPKNPELGHDRLSFVMCHGGSGADGASGSSVVVRVPSDYVMANSWE